jgi:aminoglycoside 2'-N-acetyltransferase I
MLTENRDASTGRVLRVGSLADFGQKELECARQLLDLVFDGTISDADWKQELGGVHVLVWQEDLLVGHASLTPGRLLYCGRALGTGYVDAVAVHPDCQRRGIGGCMMDVLEEIIVSNFELGALAASDAGAAFYEQRSWLRWRGPSSDLTPLVERRPVDLEEGVFVFPGTRLVDIAQSEG